MPRPVQSHPIHRLIAALAAEIFDQWSRDDAPRLAAALAYYTILSSAPLLVISVALADRVFGEQAVQGQLAWEIQTLVGGPAAQAIQELLRDAHRPATGLIAAILSVATLIVGASSAVVELHSALNLIWGVPDPDAGSWIANVWAFIRQRIISSLVVIGAGCLLLISLIASVFIATRRRFTTYLFSIAQSARPEDCPAPRSAGSAWNCPAASSEKSPGTGSRRSSQNRPGTAPRRAPFCTRSAPDGVS